jgi:3-hydroxybutyryl-CoA dehydrogenase
VGPDEVSKVGVVGCGIMGSGIVEVCARAGLAVTFVEMDRARCDAGLKKVARSFEKAVARGKIEAEARDRAMGSLKASTDIGDLADADLVIEAVTEDLSIKRQVFKALAETTKPDVILATNTSTLPVVEMAAVTGRPDKVLGMHFFNPAAVMKLLEIVTAITTAEETVEFAKAFGERIGKTTVVAKDRGGFIVNFLLIPFLNSAVNMLDEGVASKEDIDTAIKLGLGHPMGPLELSDLIGLDTALHASQQIFEEFHDPIYAPPRLLKRMVAAGQLGRKSGKGFYDYGSE